MLIFNKKYTQHLFISQGNVICIISKAIGTTKAGNHYSFQIKSKTHLSLYKSKSDLPKMKNPCFHDLFLY